jgi:hypothetical protein
MRRRARRKKGVFSKSYFVLLKREREGEEREDGMEVRE